jgi:hypothetical protein
MSGGIFGALVGALMVVVALLFLLHPKTKGQRFALFCGVVGLASVLPMVGSLVDSDREKQADLLSEQRALIREHRAREEMRRGFQRVEDEMTVAVRQMLEAYRLPPGSRRDRAIQSALLDYNRAASQLGSDSRTSAASLLPLAVANPPAPRDLARGPRAAQPTAQQATEPDVLTSAATAPTVMSADDTTPIVAPPVFIPPPPPPILTPPPMMTSSR